MILNMKCVNICLILIAISLSCCNAKNLPSFIKKCKRSDPVPELSKCVIDRAYSLKPYLIKGVPELKLPSIEPLHIPKLQLKFASANSLKLDVSLTDINVYGGNDFDVKELKFDLGKKQILLHFTLPQLRIETLYSFNGKLLFVDLVSNGNGHINISNVESKSFSNIKMETRNGKEYMIVEEDKASFINHTNPRLYFEDLFKNNQELTEHTNKILNDNTEELAKEMDPLIYESARLLVLGMINPVFKEYSLDELFD